MTSDLNVPAPPQAPQTEGLAKLPGASLYYWDTGGGGEPVILLHPYTGSAKVWTYQQPVLVKAGYRVIAYSRRGFAGSQTGARDDPTTAAEDLGALMDFLNVGRAHLIASAHGAFAALDFALSHPARVISQTLASSLLGAQEPDAKDLIARITPKDFGTYPPEFRELSPSYRAANPQGTQAWLALEEASGAEKFRQPNRHKVTYAVLEQLRTPTLLIVGDADLISPPPLQRLFQAHIPGCELVVLPESGHSAYWEQPRLFNDAVLAFIARRKA